VNGITDSESQEFLEAMGVGKQPQRLICCECGEAFIWSVRSQILAKTRGLFRPTTCVDCYRKRHYEPSGNCDRCGTPVYVTFKPDPHRTLLCMKCLDANPKPKRQD
jgi:hypothetical protein